MPGCKTGQACPGESRERRASRTPRDGRFGTASILVIDPRRTGEAETADQKQKQPGAESYGFMIYPGWDKIAEAGRKRAGALWRVFIQCQRVVSGRSVLCESGSRKLASHRYSGAGNEYVYDISIAAKRVGMKTSIVSNGYINREPLRKLLPTLDAFKIDLKGFRETFYPFCPIV